MTAHADEGEGRNAADPLTVPAGLGRRLALGACAAGYLTLSIGVDALIMILSMSVHLPIGAYTFVGTLANVAAASIGRLGYRAVVDPAILSYEDVPSTLSEFCSQRLRWNRAGI